MFKIKIAWLNMDLLIFSCMLVLTLWFGYMSINKTGYFYDNKSFIEQTANIGKYLADTIEKLNDTLYDKQIDEDDNHQGIIKLNMPQAELERIYHQLIYLMEEEKLFLNPMLKLSDLADAVNIPESYLSKIIHYYEKKTFFDFVGYYRVEEFLRLASLYDSEKYSMYYIAYEAGFNSKSTFNNVFRRIKGMPPSEYIKMNKKGPDSSAKSNL